MSERTAAKSGHPLIWRLTEHSSFQRPQLARHSTAESERGQPEGDSNRAIWIREKRIAILSSPTR